MLLAQTRPKTVSASVEKAAIAISRRRGEWGVDGTWSYDFSEFGYACSATSHSGAEPKLGDSNTEASGSVRGDVLNAALDRVLRAGSTAFRVLDLGAGSGGWLLQAKKELEQADCGRSPVVIHLHGVTGDTTISDSLGADTALFQQVAIETFPLRLGGGADTPAVEEQRVRFARAIEEEALTGGSTGYDLIVSSWTFCHLIDPLATLEIWSNALAVCGELYLNDIDFSVLFEGESTLAWQKDSETETRMARAFERLNAKGRHVDGAFRVEFVHDNDFRTAVKVTRLSAAPIRFAPVVAYYMEESSGASLSDTAGRPVYQAV